MTAIQDNIKEQQKQVEMKTTTLGSEQVPGLDGQVKTIADITKPPQSQITTDLTQKPVTLEGGQQYNLNPQEQKIREQSLKNAKQPVKTPEVVTPEQEKTMKMQDLSNFLANKPTKEAVNRYLKINYKPQYKEDYSNTLRGYYNTQKTNAKVQKYSTETPQVIDKAVKNGDLVPGTDAYNLLPPEKRKEYEDYKNLQIASTITTKFKAPQVDFSEILEKTKEIFSTNYKKEFADKLKSPEITKLNTEMSSIDEQIKVLDDKMEYLDTDRAEQRKGVPSGLQDKLNAKEKRDLIREKNVLINQYNSKLNTLNTIKDDINTELDIAKLDDENAKEAYKSALSIYQTERARMDNFALANFEAENKARAEERARDFTKEMEQIRQDFETKNQKPTYQIARDGKMYAIVDGVATPVKSFDGEPLFGEETKDYQQQAYKNEDGTYSIITTYTDGRSPTMTTLGANGQNVSGNVNIQGIIAKCRETGQCGAGANDYAQNLGLGRIFPNSYESKSKYINSDTPSVGGFAIWNPNQGQGKYSEYGHVGIVTGYNQETGKVTITDWNYDGDETQKTHDVNLSEITYNGGFFDITKPVGDIYTPQIKQGFSDEDIALLSSVEKLDKQGKETLKQAGLTTQDWANMNAGLLPPTPKQKTQAQEILNAISSLEKDSGFSGAVGFSLQKNPFGDGAIPGTKTADFISRFNSFRDNLVLPNLGQLKGPMSDKDIQFLRNSATALNLGMSESGFKEELLKIKEKYAKIAGVETTLTTTQTTLPPQTQGGSLIQEYNSRPKIDFDN